MQCSLLFFYFLLSALSHFLRDLIPSAFYGPYSLHLRLIGALLPSLTFSLIIQHRGLTRPGWELTPNLLLFGKQYEISCHVLKLVPLF
jgi:hypothetical protein